MHTYGISNSLLPHPEKSMFNTSEPPHIPHNGEQLVIPRRLVRSMQQGITTECVQMPPQVHVALIALTSVLTPLTRIMPGNRLTLIMRHRGQI